ncbi:MAG: hypothetical protein ACXVCY_07735, partial [Pseudobdellovibrionaceae bacterium]
GWAYSRRWAEWMTQGDPLAVAVEEARTAGLRVFADVGMNVTHILDAPWLTERAVVEHPEWLSDHKMYLDYTVLCFMFSDSCFHLCIFS